MRAGVPLHRRALRVAAEAHARHVFLERVLDPVRRDGNVGHADFVAVIQRGRAAERQQQHRRHARLGRSRCGWRCAGCRDCPAPSWASRRTGSAASYVCTASLIGRRLPRHGDQLEIERHVRAAAALAVVSHQLLDRQVDLADHHPLVVAVQHRPHLRDDCVDFGLVGGVGRKQFVVGFWPGW